jgi:hypothetical protein
MDHQDDQDIWERLNKLNINEEEPEEENCDEYYNSTSVLININGKEWKSLLLKPRKSEK